jgi:hypothetical protein
LDGDVDILRSEDHPQLAQCRFSCILWRTLKEGVETMANLDWSQCPAVESIPGKVSGAWVFKDTRLPVATIIENLEDLHRGSD